MTSTSLHTVKPPFAATAGADSPKIVILGEAWGESEERTRRPFAGESGRELWRMLGEAMPNIEPELYCQITDVMNKYGDAWVADRQQWLEAAGVAMTNVLAFRPPGNKLDVLCGAKKEVGEYAASFPPLSRGLYLKEEYLPELDRLYFEINTWNPNLVICTGNTACWAILKATNIGSIRGAITSAEIPTGNYNAVHK